MIWDFQGDRPIYLQIVEQVQLRIVSGYYPAGSKLPAVRDLAAEASVNPNTMQKALAELERKGLVYSQRTAGRFITEDKSMIEQIKQSLAREQVDEFLKKMQALGCTVGEVITLLSQMEKEEIK
ncbi:GntR family transcriptional regulator [bacterium 1XD42-1]|jgi:DNA-binding transcriptional regulator YhcF (GntR family)|nr:GntR family transcriptional regulator [Oscillospiraceae bacterium]MCI9668828.1 GntR family transcriptional regulator [Oscillospiraceae bacterium]RKJ54709.1 GntR family transcriptional regulator [bacterium 1XD42-8]RKJ63663.1 GntR family transcriptional regulator [bacterium 1XD42-1]